MFDPTPSLETFWQALLLHLWHTSLVLAFVLLLARGLRRAPARWLDILWTVALVKLVLPSTVLSGALTRLAGASTAGSDGAPPLAATLSAVLIPSEVVQPLVHYPAFAIVATAIWIVGVVWGYSRLLRLFRAVRSEGGAVPDAAESATLEAALRGGLLDRSAIRVVDLRCVPCVVGYARPRILVPRMVLRELSAPEVRALLLHEEEHRRRREPLRLLIGRLISIAFFFYPLAGCVVARMREAAELVCDEHVVRAGVPRGQYARALAKTVSLGLSGAALPLSAGTAGGGLLRRRLERLEHERSGSPMKRDFGILMFALIALVTSFVAPSAPRASDAAGEADSTAVAYDTPPRATYMAPAAYPAEVREAGGQGTVLLAIRIGADGSNLGIEVLNEVAEHPALTQAAIEALRQWRWTPAELEGESVECRVAVPFKFALD